MEITIGDEQASEKEPYEALRQAKNVIESSPVVLFRWRATKGWPVDFVTDNVTQFGYQAEDFLSGRLSFADIMHKDDVSQVEYEIEKWANTRTDLFCQEYRIFTGDGQMRWVSDRTVFEYDADGQVTHYQGTLLDITERKQAEEALRQTQERYEIAVLGSRDGLWDWNFVSGELYLSRRARAMLGYTPHDSINNPRVFAEHLHPDEKMNIVQSVRRYLQGGGQCYEAEHRLRHKDGRYIWVHARGAVLRDAMGKAVRWAGSLTNVTESKKAAETLYQAKIVVENSPVVLLRSRADKELSLEYVSENISQFGYCAEELLATNCSFVSLLHPGDRERAEAGLLDHVKSGATEFSQTYRIYTADGQIRWVEDNVQIRRDIQGKVTAFQGVLLDITERREMESAMRRAKEAAEAANETKSMFLSNMTHELRTPMNGVLGITDLLLDTPLNKEQREMVDIIRSSGDTLLKIINDVLDFSKIEAGKLTLEKVPLRLSDIIEETLGMFSAEVRAKGLNLTWSIDPDVPNEIIQDVTRLRQAMTNLVSNAVKFTDQGSVDLHVNAKELEGGDYHIQFAVQDTGIGIPRERLGQLFQFFSQADVSTTRKYGGTGLGLAITQQLCELMGGTIWVASKVGVGSTFYFTVVASKAHPTQVATQRQAVGIGGMHRQNVRILDEHQADNREEDEYGIDKSKAEKNNVARSEAEALNCPQAVVEVDLRSEKSQHEQEASTKEQPKAEPAQQKSTKQESTKQESTKQKPTQQESFKILLVEDNIVNQKVAMGMLEKCRYSVDLAENGLEAIDALKRQFYDVVLMDIHMPEMDGVTATKQIRETFPADEQPTIIAITADAMKLQQHTYLAAGMDDFLSKPLRISALQEMIEGTARARH